MLNFSSDFMASSATGLCDFFYSDSEAVSGALSQCNEDG